LTAEQTTEWLEAAQAAPADDEVMYVDVGGYEGPLDLLLDLARRQKVDLSQISVLALAEQYLGFIETVREKRIEIAADYLVMAAWLAYLKSRLMVPQAASDDEPTGEIEPMRIELRTVLAVAGIFNIFFFVYPGPLVSVATTAAKSLFPG